MLYPLYYVWKRRLGATIPLYYFDYLSYPFIVLLIFNIDDCADLLFFFVKKKILMFKLLLLVNFISIAYYLKISSEYRIVLSRFIAVIGNWPVPKF